MIEKLQHTKVGNQKTFKPQLHFVCEWKQKQLN
jgi:hypothetical protein